MAKKKSTTKPAKRPVLMEYWRSLSDAQFYWHFRRRRGGKIAAYNPQGYKRKGTMMKCAKEFPGYNFDFIEIVEIEDPNSK